MQREIGKSKLKRRKLEPRPSILGIGFCDFNDFCIGELNVVEFYGIIFSPIMSVLTISKFQVLVPRRLDEGYIPGAREVPTLHLRIDEVDAEKNVKGCRVHFDRHRHHSWDQERGRVQDRFRSEVRFRVFFLV